MQPRIPIEEIHPKPSIPLALLSVAAPICGEFSVKIIDQRLNKEWKKELQRELENKPLCVGITSMTGNQLKYALEASRFVKEISPDTPVVFGGVHVSLEQETTLKEKSIDAIVVGEGERAFEELIRDIKEHGHPSKKVWRTAEFLDMDVLPPIPYHLVDMEKYVQIRSGRRSIIIQTSRGCAFNCRYCYNMKMNKCRYRTMSAENVLARVKELKEKFNVEHLLCHDDELFLDLPRARKIIAGILELGMTFETSGSRVDSLERMDDDYLRLIEKAGTLLYVGAESGSEKILDLIDKKITVEQIIRINKRLSGFKFMPHYNFVVGFPTETDDDIKKSISLAFQLLKENPNARITALMSYTAWPGNYLYDNFMPPENRPKTMDEWADYQFDTANLPWLNAAKKKTLKVMYIASRAMDKKYETYVSSRPLKLLIRMYQPFARFRLKHFFFGFGFLERWFYEKLV